MNFYTPHAGGAACDNERNSDAEGFEGVKNTIETIFSRDGRQVFEGPQNGALPTVFLSSMLVASVLMQFKGREGDGARNWSSIPGFRDS